MKRVVLAPNAFKGTFDAVEVAELWRDALAGKGLDIVSCPMSDGGDGFLGAARAVRPGGLTVMARAVDALGRWIDAPWLWDPGSGDAFIESAAAIGMRHLATAERDPRRADSAGLSHLLRTAARVGARCIRVGLGGSATVDGGFGMARDMGFGFESAAGGSVECPADLEHLARITLPDDGPPASAAIVALVDVDAPLLGPAGAARAYGPQKGADANLVERLEAGMARLFECMVADLGVDADLVGCAGAGAAGGLGAGLAAFLSAELAPGAEWCAAAIGFDRAIERADLVVTGEGAFDARSMRGKATGWVVSRAAALGVPVVVVCGRLAAGPPPRASALDAAALGLEPGTVLGRAHLAELARRAVTERLDSPAE